MGSLSSDIRQALRLIVKQPGITLVVALTLALGLGANAVVFSMIDALILRPLPIPDADRMVMFDEVTPQGSFTGDSVSPANFSEWRRETRSLERLAAGYFHDVNLLGPESTEAMPGYRATSGFFEVLGQPIAVGRSFTPEDEAPGEAQVAVISHGLWSTRFREDPGVLGTVLQIDGKPHTVVGVTPPTFEFPAGTQIWTNLQFNAASLTDRRTRNLTVIGRMAPGVSLDEVRAEYDAFAARLRAAYPELYPGWRVELKRLNDALIDEGAPAMLSVWQAAAAFVLLIGCANVANLLLARGAGRQRELAVRRAIGATRFDIVRQLMVESLVLCGVAVVLSIGMAAIAIRAVRAAMPAVLARFVTGWSTMDVDGRLLLFVLSCAVVTTVFFGLIPALSASRAPADRLKDGARGSTEGRGGRTRRVLIVGEVALSLALLVAAGLVVAGSVGMIRQSWGFDRSGLLTFKTRMPEDMPEDGRRRFFESLTERLERDFGTGSAAIANSLPASNSNASRVILFEGETPSPDGSVRRSDFRTVSLAYFTTMRIPVIAGRAFGSGDRPGTTRVAMVSQEMARRYWPDQNPVGQRFRSGADGPWVEVVGVAADVVHHWFDRRRYPTFYVPLAQEAPSRAGVVIRHSADTATAVSRARAAIRDVDPARPIYEIDTMDARIHVNTIGLWFAAVVMGVLGGLALVLASVGVFSVMSYAVSQRTHEFGVRIALGATGRDLLGLVLSQAGRLTLGGIALGTVLAIAAAMAIESLLFGIVTFSIVPLIVFPLILTAAALLAAWIPARHALRVDPVLVLRRD